MSSPSLDADTATGPHTGTLPRLLDPVFGFFVWAAHLLTVYAIAAVVCIVAPGTTSTGAVRITLAVVTVAALAVTAWHALRRHRELRALPEQRFRIGVTLGGDALAAAAIAAQLIAVVLVPVCA